MTKWEFIQHEVITLSIHGAFQRAKVYVSEASDDSARESLRKRLAILLRDLGSQYTDSVGGEQHKINIKKIADDLTAEFEGRNLLYENRFRIGIAQKALNLYLKYLWCMGKAERPPHCPFDAGIIDKLKPQLTKLQKNNLQWTKLDSLEDYQTLVDAGLMKIKTTQYSSLSDWELDQWNPESNRR